MLYHFSTLELLPSILRHGLLCRVELEAQGILYDDDPGKWGRWEKADEFGGYVCLSVVPPWGMMHGRTGVFLLQITAEVLTRDSTLFSGLWSSDNSVTLEGLKARSGVKDFDELFDGPTTGFPRRLSGKAFCPGEVLVPGSTVPAEFRGLVFRTNDDLERARTLVREHRPAVPPGLRVSVEPNRFGGGG